MNKKKDKPKRKNHEVGKSLLKSWRDTQQPGEGIWLFDLETQKIELRSKDATFAIHSYLYVPSIDGERDDSVEDWLAETENQLANFIQRIDTRDFQKPIAAKDLITVVHGLLALSYRSGYEIKHLQKILKSDQNLRDQMGITSEDDIHRAVVDNMVNRIKLQAQQYIGGAVQIIFDCKTPILICDRPGFDVDARGFPFAVIPIRADAVVMIEKPGGKLPAGLSWTPDNGQTTVVEMLNLFTIKRARSWVVATTKEQLESIKDDLTPDKILVNVEKDTVKFLQLKSN